MASYTIYEKPTCSTCRNVMQEFRARGIDFDDINYIIDPPSKATLKKIVAGIDCAPRDLVRTKEPEFKELGIDPETLTASTVVDLLAAHPTLLQRPVIEHNGKYLLGRPAEKVAAWLDGK